MSPISPNYTLCPVIIEMKDHRYKNKNELARREILIKVTSLYKIV
jgi:hypothetical protein